MKIPDGFYIDGQLTPFGGNGTGEGIRRWIEGRDFLRDHLIEWTAVDLDAVLYERNELGTRRLDYPVGLGCAWP
jgi:hypothetical protein